MTFYEQELRKLFADGTVLAAVLEGYSATGIEVTDAYAALARGRIRQALEDVQ